MIKNILYFTKKKIYIYIYLLYDFRNIFYIENIKKKFIFIYIYIKKNEIELIIFSKQRKQSVLNEITIRKVNWEKKNLIWKVYLL